MYILLSMALAATPPFRDADDLALALHQAASMVDADNGQCQKAAAAVGPLPADEAWLDRLGAAAGAYATCLCEASFSCRSSSSSEQKQLTDNLRIGLIAKLAANGRIAPELAGPGADLGAAWALVASSPMIEDLAMEQLRGLEGLSSTQSDSSTALLYQGLNAELWTASLDPRFRFRVADVPGQPLEVLRLINEGNLRMGRLRLVLDPDGLWLEGQPLTAESDFRAKFLEFIADVQGVRPSVDAVVAGSSTAAGVVGGW
jgi:hypothetical protein